MIPPMARAKRKNGGSSHTCCAALAFTPIYTYFNILQKVFSTISILEDLLRLPKSSSFYQVPVCSAAAVAPLPIADLKRYFSMMLSLPMFLVLLRLASCRQPRRRMSLTSSLCMDACFLWKRIYPRMVVRRKRTVR